MLNTMNFGKGMKLKEKLNKTGKTMREKMPTEVKRLERKKYKGQSDGV